MGMESGVSWELGVNTVCPPYMQGIYSRSPRNPGGCLKSQKAPNPIHAMLSASRSREIREMCQSELKWKPKGSMESRLDGVLLGQTREGTFR